MVKEHSKKLEPGKKYGRWVWLGDEPVRTGRGYYSYPLLCDCGNTKLVDGGNVLKGKSKSCGCLNAELLSARATHGKSREPIFDVWNMMVQRCHNPSYRRYDNYGGRGIKVCDKWQEFSGFYGDMGDRPFEGATLERLDNDGPYCKSNCVWATRKVQNLNKRNTVFVEYRGKTYKLRELTQSRGMDNFKVYQRIHTYGWSVERAIDTP